jgi:hypothetical protein
LHPAKDIDGLVRPLRVPSDLGASQNETALVVPGAAIGAARIGMDTAAVAARYGRPQVSTRGSGAVARTERYRAHGGWLDIGYGSSGRVVRLVTTSEYYSTAAGVGPGAVVRAGLLRPSPCSKSKLDATLRGTSVEVRASVAGSSAHVTRVGVAARGYSACALLKKR